MTEESDRVDYKGTSQDEDRAAGRYGAANPDFEEQLTQTARDGGIGDAGDMANDLRFAEEQELINRQAGGEIPDTDDATQSSAGRLREEGIEDAGLDEANGAIDVPDQELEGTGQEDASDDAYHAGDEQ
jgi:general stress protein YciG